MHQRTKTTRPHTHVQNYAVDFTAQRSAPVGRRFGLRGPRPRPRGAIKRVHRVCCGASQVPVTAGSPEARSAATPWLRVSSHLKNNKVNSLLSSRRARLPSQPRRPARRTHFPLSALRDRRKMQSQDKKSRQMLHARDGRRLTGRWKALTPTWVVYRWLLLSLCEMKLRAAKWALALRVRFPLGSRARQIAYFEPARREFGPMDGWDVATRRLICLRAGYFRFSPGGIFLHYSRVDIWLANANHVWFN